MPNEKIAQMVSDAPGQVSGIEDSLVQVDNQIDELQAQQDALQEVLEQLYSEVIPVLTPQCDFLYHGENFYSGSGIGTIDSNIVNWGAYNLVAIPVIGQMYYNITIIPPTLQLYDGVLFTTPYEQVIIVDTEVQEKYDEFDFTIDAIHHPVGLTGTYGTKGNIEMLNNGKGILAINRDKLLDTQTKLLRFGEE